jgi:hypothetical protein
MDDPGSRALAYGQRAVDDPRARVTEDRVTGNALALARDDDAGDQTPGGGGSGATSVSLPSPWPPTLDAKLTDVSAPHPLRAAMDVVSGNAHFKGMTFALADLSTAGTRSYAGSHDNEQRFIASTGKLAILFAAFQLRKAMREAGALVTDKAVKKDTQLFDAVMRQWRAKIGRYFHGTKGSNDSLPSLAEIFVGTPRAAGGWGVDFASTPRGGTGRAFTDRLKQAVMNSDDDDAGSCIRDLGFPYVNGCLAEAGIRKRGKGLWVALDYAGQFWWPETFNEVGSPQAATARSLVDLMTLLEFDELVPGSRSEMIDLLSGARAGSPVGVISYITIGLRKYLPTAARATLDVRAKVGYTVANTHTDTAIVKHAAKPVDVRYTVAILNAVDADMAEDAARALDSALVASH